MEEISLSFSPASSTTNVVVDDALIPYLSVLNILLDEDIWETPGDMERFEAALWALWESVL